MPGPAPSLETSSSSTEIELLRKAAAGDADAYGRLVRGVDGFWISGHPHDVVLRGSDGAFSPAALRLAGNTLLWEQGNVTYRLESGLDRAAAVSLAEALR